MSVERRTNMLEYTEFRILYSLITNKSMRFHMTAEEKEKNLNTLRKTWFRNLYKLIPNKSMRFYLTAGE